MIVLLSIICNLSATCQDTGVIDAISTHFSYFSLSRPSTTLFVHFDKNIYTNSEKVWFTGYLIRSDSSLEAYRTMAIALVGNRDKKVWKEARYVMHQGIASGCLTLPDTIPPGGYTLLAYTNLTFNNMPEDVFLQPITVKTAEDGFDAFVWVDTSSAQSKGTVDIEVRSTDKTSKPLANTEVFYYIGSETRPELSGHSRTNHLGTAVFILPSSEFTESSALHVLLKQEVAFKTFNLPLPACKPPAISVGFYPEGGNLVAATPCRVGWEVRREDGRAMLVKGVLYESGVAIDTVRTNQSGMGSFRLTAKAGKRYQVELLDPFGSKSYYPLPQPLPPAPAVSITKGVVNDSLAVQVQNIGGSQPLYLIIHSTESIFAAYVVRSPQVSKKLTLPLTKVPKGVAMLTLIDSQGRPFAERLFFAHYDQTAYLEVATDGFHFKPKQAVHLTLHLHASNGQKQEAVVSVACIQNNRIDYRNYTDIESYVYITHVLENTAAPTAFPGVDKMAYLEQLLLIKGWRRFRWQDVMGSTPEDTLGRRSSLVFSGEVQSGGRKVHKAMALSLVNNSTLQLISADAGGKFSLDDRILTTPPEGKIQFLVNASNAEAYQIALHDPYKTIDERLVEAIGSAQSASLTEAPTDSTEAAPTDYRGVLSTVVVKTKPNNNDIFYPPVTSTIGRNQCGDYICINRVLNCPVHKDDFRNKPPIVGLYYFIYGSANPGGVKYVGCTTAITKQKGVFLDGIYTNKEFYLPDSIDLASPAPLYLSTLYWNPSVLLSSGEDAKMTFFTGDLEGRYKVIVQGRTSTDVISGEASFVVSRK